MPSAVLEILRARRATRAIDTTRVSDEIITELIEAARLAPSCFNKQPWRYIFMEGADALATGRGLLTPGNASWASQAPLLVLACASRDDDCVTQDGRAYFQFDLGLSVMNLMLMATERGLVARPMAGFDRLGLAHVEWFARLVERHPPKTITLDIDGYDAETYGMQQLALFNGCYEETMYYPVVVTVAEYGFVVGGQIRPGNAGANVGAVELMRPILEALRRLLPNTRIRLRADSGFMDPDLYRLLEEYRVQYAIRLKMNEVLKGYFDGRLTAAGERMARRKPDEEWALYHRRTYKAGSWDKRRNIVMKLQYDPDKRSVDRYVVVTNMRRGHRGVWKLYEHRGQCEQRNDELKNHLRAEKFSCCLFAANAVKLHLILMAHNLLAAVRIMLPEKHELKRATVDRLRVTLIKCGATVVLTARRLWIHASRTWPNRRHLQDAAVRFTARHLVPTPLWNAG